MRHVVISAYTRPHVLCDCHQPCWCQPRVETCDCDHDCGEVLVHRGVDLHRVESEHMAVFSEQMTFGLT